MSKDNRNIKSIRDAKLEDLKEFIKSVQEKNEETPPFKAERLESMRVGKTPQKYSSGLST